MQKIKCAVIGTGYLGKFHAEKYTKIPDAELIAICDSNPERAKEISQLYNIEALIDYRKLIGKVDAVSIVVPTTLHYQITKEFLENSIHVLLEKPVTTTVAEAEELIMLAKRNNLILQIGHLERFNSVFKTLKPQVNQPLLIETQRLAPFKERGTDVSVILDLMIHDIDLILTLLPDAAIIDIEAAGTPVLSPTIDVACARLQFDNGCIANLKASRTNPEMVRQLTVLQNGTYFIGNLQNPKLNIYSKSKTEELELTKTDAILEETQAFIHAIINRQKPLISGENGRDALAVALQIEGCIKNK
jgi:predicted dehydrogenase